MNNAELFYRASQPRQIDGTPPLTFRSNGTPITDYTITGAAGGVGEQTAQMIAEVVQGSVNSSTGITSDNPRRVRTTTITIEGEETYTIDAGTQYTAIGCFYDANGDFISAIDNYGAKKTVTFTTPENAAFFIGSFAKQNTSSTLTPSELTGYMLNEGSTALPAEPYGYKIPVSCGGVTTDIYIGNSALGEGDSVSYADTGTAIATAAGENTLTIDTTVQPSDVTIKTAGTLPPALEQALRLKYDIRRG